MSRYIDADKLSIYFEALATQAETEGLYNMAHIHRRCLQLLKEAPTADVVEVVRCRDCRWCEVTNWDGEILYGCDCCGGMNDIAPDYYCSYGERKDDGK